MSYQPRCAHIYPHQNREESVFSLDLRGPGATAYPCRDSSLGVRRKTSVLEASDEFVSRRGDLLSGGRRLSRRASWRTKQPRLLRTLLRRVASSSLGEEDRDCRWSSRILPTVKLKEILTLRASEDTQERWSSSSLRESAISCSEEGDEWSNMNASTRRSERLLLGVPLSTEKRTKTTIVRTVSKVSPGRSNSPGGH